ncbi:MAG: hypothetical protein J0I20_14320 [Chloroflexi bacterium]|nr:hypothetical protein [Chloroflexota bacterium]
MANPVIGVTFLVIKLFSAKVSAEVVVSVCKERETNELLQVAGNSQNQSCQEEIKQFGNL